MKVLILSSGGIDSTTCLAMAVETYGKENVVALSMTYGQKHDKEIQAAQAVSDYYKVEHITMDLTKLFSYSNSSLLRHSTQELPKESYNEQLKDSDGSPLSTYVPFRNGLFLSAAASIALSKDCEILFYGAHSDDAAGSAYPDCSEAFNTAMNTAIYEGSGHQLRVEAPFISKHKADIVKIGLDRNVPYELTWSCYEGVDKPCGVCGTCIDRKNAFLKNGVEDPLKY